MNVSRSWPLAILLLGLAGCGPSSNTTSAGKSPAELVESGKAALAQGKPDQAIVDFTSALDVEPQSAPAHEGRAAAFLQLKKFSQAVNDCDLALKIDDKLASAYFMRGQAERRLDDLEKALGDFSKALDNGLAQVDVLTARGALYYSLAKTGINPDEATKNLENARKDLDRAVKLDPQQVECRMQRAAVCIDLREYQDAVDDCDEVLKADPNLAAAYVIRARGECELSEIKSAITDCQSAIHLDASLFEAYVLRAKARLEKAAEMRTLDEVAECDHAVDDCREAIERSKKFQGNAEGMRHAKRMRGLAHELRGSIYQALRAAKKALAEYEQALELDPFLVSALLRRAVTRTNLEDYAGALHDCNTAISIDRVRPEAYNGRGWIYAVKQEYPKAVEDFTQAVALGKCPEAYSRRALVYSTMADQEMARATELSKLKRSADRPEIAAHLERVKELWQKTIADATRAIEGNRHLARAYLTRAVVYGRQRLFQGTSQDLQKPLDDLNAAVREDPAMAQAYFNRAVFHANLGQLDAAVKDFEETSKLVPNNPGIYHRLYLVHQKRGDPILAAKYYTLWQEKEKSKRDERDLENFGLAVKRKSGPEAELKPDSDLEPLEKAKIDLQDKLDATAEK